VLLNLLSNSAKFTTRGAVGLTVRPREDAEGRRVIEFEVVDNGIGIEAAKMDKLFQPFVQVDATTTRKYSGSGLGLAISHRLCQLMGGDIQVRSEPGRLTSFMVTLPAGAPHHG
jgi:signal transduction histidine kinase